ncbi:BAI1-associated protein 3-like [Argiope bruennichi]|uniref:BAI1-associated protein 3-like n=1 Tax=Argiope bruennichi TaxID=94029 RepID=UPI0024953235|nr:BAI1-associated protein 3-like [Argiope bruennichi]
MRDLAHKRILLGHNICDWLPACCLSNMAPNHEYFDGELKIEVFTKKLDNIYEIFCNAVDKKSTTAKERENFLNLKNDLLIMFEEVIHMTLPVHKSDAVQPQNVMELISSLSLEFAAFREDINNRVDNIAKKVFLKNDVIENDGIVLASKSSFCREVVNTQIETDVETYVSMACNGMATSMTDGRKLQNRLSIKRYGKYESKPALNGLRQKSKFKKWNKKPMMEATVLSGLNPETTGKEWEKLYVAVLYIIKHKVGANSRGYSMDTEDLYEYAQEAFCMSDVDHKRLFNVAQDKKPPILVLNVIVVEAQDLQAKDPNGFSDPYCMLGIQPRNTVDGRSSSDDELVTSTKEKRPKHNGNFKSTGTPLWIRIPGVSISEALPENFSRVTSVKSQTRNPRWNEQFRLDIEDIRTDTFHLDIWDQDDESSVFDAAGKLNEVSSLKGVGRYFKQIAQSARTSNGENVDDFLGCISIRLQDIPSSGLDHWFDLEGRTERSSVQGQIHLKLSFSTRDAKEGNNDEGNWKEVVELMELMWIFIQHALKQHIGPSYEWTGSLFQPALDILHQHAIHGDVTELQQALCRWITYSKLLTEVPLDYALLCQLLEDIAQAWGDEENPLSRVEETALAESFSIFLDYCLKIIQGLRDHFPPEKNFTRHKLAHFLKCLCSLHDQRAFRCCCPTRLDLQEEITCCLKEGTLNWFNAQVANAQSKHEKDSKWSLRSLTDLINILNTDVYNGYRHYNEKFESIIGISYSIIVYKQLEKMVSDVMSHKIQDTCSTLEPEEDSDLESEYMKIATVTFELYMALQEFIKFKDNLPSEEIKDLSLVNYHLWFKDAVDHWFVVAKTKSQIRIKKAVELDEITFLDKYVKYSTSAVDTETCFVQIKEFWKQLSWPDPVGSFSFVKKAIEIICEDTVHYAKLCQENLEKIIKAESQDDVTDKFCVTVNNMEHVLQTLRTFEDELGIEQIIKTLNLNQSCCTATQRRDAIYDLISKSEDDVRDIILTIICDMVEKLRPNLKKLVFDLAWAPDKLDAEDVICPLLENLDATLQTLYNNLLQSNFDRLLNTMWTVLMQELMETAQSNIGYVKERLTFFDRLYSSLKILVDFFHDSGKGLSLERIQNTPYQDLFHMLKLQKSETRHLIELYTLEKFEEQQKLMESTYGVLTVKASYNSATESLFIYILNAKKLIPLDPSGFSDPFVIIELVPRHFFPNCVKQSTNVQKKTLFPLFDEAFEFAIPVDLLHREGAGLCFSVMDHDMVTKDDFEGEAFLPLCNIPESSSEEMKLFELCLMQPNDKNEIIEVLTARTWDKDAQDFVNSFQY